MTPSLLILSWAGSIGRGRALRLALRQTPGLTTVFSDEHRLVLVSPSLSHMVKPGGLMLLGSVHGRAPDATRGMAADVLRNLTCHSWGGYLAIMARPEGSFAMVDPSGAGRAHLVQDDDLVMITDALTPALMRSAGFPISIDLAALAGCLVDPGAMVSAPLLQGVTPMTPGVMYDLSQEKQPEIIWSPIQIVPELGGAQALRPAVEAAITGMVAGKMPLVELSGGLDSSIIAGTMVELGIAPRAVTVELIGGDVDEVRYARATAELCAIPLHVGRVVDYPRYATFMEAEQAAHPYVYGVDDAFAGVVRDGVTAETDLVVTGQGGDAVFYQPATPFTTIDRCRVLGLRSGWKALLDDARRTRSSVWRHIRPVITDRFRHAVAPEDELAGNLLSAEARKGRTRFVHPWLAEARDQPPGRQLQILMLANSQSFHSARAVDLGRPMIHPLLAQPVLEAALAIPTWQLAHGPLDRGLARAVFAARLHPDIAGRRSKGEAAAFYSRTAAANLPYLKERLLGGALAGSGIIDKAVMEQSLTPEYLFYSMDYRALILHASCEAWLAAWKA